MRKVSLKMSLKASPKTDSRQWTRSWSSMFADIQKSQRKNLRACWGVHRRQSRDTLRNCRMCGTSAMVTVGFGMSERLRVAERDKA